MSKITNDGLTRSAIAVAHIFSSRHTAADVLF